MITGGKVKKGVHPDYRPVVFRDRSADFLMLTRSTRTSTETVELDGGTYPVVDVDVSTASHPFWTGRGRVLDTEGRVDRFERRYGVRR
jgi:large subunit ribosomal protein L31